MLKVTFKRINLFIKVRYDDINKYTHFDIYEIEAYEYALKTTGNKMWNKEYMKEVKNKIKQNLKDQGFKL